MDVGLIDSGNSIELSRVVCWFIIAYISDLLKQILMRVIVALLLQLLQLQRAGSSIHLQTSPYLRGHNINRQLLEYWAGV